MVPLSQVHTIHDIHTQMCDLCDLLCLCVNVLLLLMYYPRCTKPVGLRLGSEVTGSVNMLNTSYSGHGDVHSRFQSEKKVLYPASKLQ